MNQAYSWLRKFLKKERWLFEILSFFLIFETFAENLYVSNDNLSGWVALRVAFWLLIVLVAFVILVDSEREISWEEDRISHPLSPLLLMKYLTKGLFSVLFFVTGVTAYHQVRDNYNDVILITNVWGIIVFLLILEVSKFLLRKLTKKTSSKLDRPRNLRSLRPKRVRRN